MSWVTIVYTGTLAPNYNFCTPYISTPYIYPIVTWHCHPFPIRFSVHTVPPHSGCWRDTQFEGPLWKKIHLAKQWERGGAGLGILKSGLASPMDACGEHLPCLQKIISKALIIKLLQRHPYEPKKPEKHRRQEKNVIYILISSSSLKERTPFLQHWKLKDALCSLPWCPKLWPIIYSSGLRQDNVMMLFTSSLTDVSGKLFTCLFSVKGDLWSVLGTSTLPTHTSHVLCHVECFGDTNRLLLV